MSESVPDCFADLLLVDIPSESVLYEIINEMNTITVRVFCNIVWPPDAGQVHHCLRPGSLEDRARLKQTMIHSHVFVAVACSKHYQGCRIDHFVSMCNCSGYSYPEITEIVQEVYHQYIFPLEYYVVTKGFPLHPLDNVRDMVVSSIHDFYPYNPAPDSTCTMAFLKLINLAKVYKEVTDHSDDDAPEGCTMDGLPPLGYLHKSAQFMCPGTNFTNATYIVRFNL